MSLELSEIGKGRDVDARDAAGGKDFFKFEVPLGGNRAVRGDGLDENEGIPLLPVCDYIRELIMFSNRHPQFDQEPTVQVQSFVSRVAHVDKSGAGDKMGQENLDHLPLKLIMLPW